MDFSFGCFYGLSPFRVRPFPPPATVSPLVKSHTFCGNDDARLRRGSPTVFVRHPFEFGPCPRYEGRKKDYFKRALFQNNVSSSTCTLYISEKTNFVKIRTFAEKKNEIALRASYGNKNNIRLMSRTRVHGLCDDSRCPGGNATRPHGQAFAANAWKSIVDSGLGASYGPR